MEQEKEAKGFLKYMKEKLAWVVEGFANITGPLKDQIFEEIKKHLSDILKELKRLSKDPKSFKSKVSEFLETRGRIIVTSVKAAWGVTNMIGECLINGLRYTVLMIEAAITGIWTLITTIITLLLSCVGLTSVGVFIGYLGSCIIKACSIFMQVCIIILEAVGSSLAFVMEKVGKFIVDSVQAAWEQAKLGDDQLEEFIINLKEKGPEFFIDFIQKNEEMQRACVYGLAVGLAGLLS